MDTSGLDCYYRHGSFVEFYSYMGQSALLLAMFAAIGLWRVNRAVRSWVAIAATAGVLTLGLPPLQWLLHFVPVYNLFRAPARHLYELNFALCVLTMYGLQALTDRTLQRRDRLRFLRWSVVAIGSLVLAAVCGSQYIRFVMKHLADPAYQGAAQFFGQDLHLFELMAPSIYAHLALWRPIVLFPIIFFAASAYLLSQMAKQMRSGWKVVLPVVLVLDIWLPYHAVYANPDTTPLFHPDSRSDIAHIGFS